MVFGPVGSIDFVVDVVGGVDERDILRNTGDLYPALVPLLGATEPMSTAPPNRSDEYVVTLTDGPHGHRFT